MGIPGAWDYGVELGSVIESVDKSLAKIKSNRFDKSDLEKCKSALEKAVIEFDKAIANEN